MFETLLALPCHHLDGRYGKHAMKTFASYKRRAATLAKVIARAKLSIWVTVVATLQLTGNQAMPQPKCDFMKVAEDFIAKQFPFFNSTGKTLVISEDDQLREMTYRLPVHMLGGAPIITIDKQACAIVRVQLTQ